MSDIETIDGFFGEKIHYKNGERVGESWPGLFGGSYNHYDTEGVCVGHSDVGVFADEVHYDENYNRLGCSYRGLFGTTHHYDDDGYCGYSIDKPLSTGTYLFDDDDSIF